MPQSTLKISKIKEVKTPERIGKNAGFDFFVPEDEYVRTLEPHESVLIPSGIKVRLPKGHALIAFNKSSIASKYKLQIGACVIDENYMGEIHLNVINVGSNVVLIKPGMKLVQFILLPINYAMVEVLSEDELYKDFDKNERGEDGFGSTGV